MREARPPMRGLAHAPFRQMQARGADLGRQSGIVSDQQPRQSIQLPGQVPPHCGIARAHDHDTARRQAARGSFPVRRAIVGHHHQGHIGVEALTVLE